MRQFAKGIAAWSVLLLIVGRYAHAAGADGLFDGEWRTNFGAVTLKQVGADVTGTYGDANQFTLTGTVDGRKLTFEYQEGPAAGEGHWMLDPANHSFRGSFKIRGGRSGTWEGWRPDPQTPKAKAVKVAGLWLTDLGLMELEEAGGKVTGRFALRGDSTIEGTLTGRRLEFTYKSFRPGKGWFDASADGQTLAGAAGTDGAAPWFGWRGRRAPEYARHAKLVAGRIVEGSTRSLLTYSARAPQQYREGDAKKWPAVVILHGSNMKGRDYVATIASAWPDVARDYVLIGINGERPSDIGKEPRFNYTYVNYVGRSTFKGFPGTDRESPALVAEALVELREAYPLARYFVGGHSQGGFLTYSLLMNSPELIAGAFPISAGVIFQCEPSAYADQQLRAAQRKVPLAIVHGRQDQVVAFSTGEYAATLFGEAGWPAFRFFADGSGAGHRFGMLPVGQAIRWLEAHASDEPAKLLDFAEQRLKARAYRDAITALNRAASLKPDEAARARLDRLMREVEALAAKGASDFLARIRDPQDKGWVDAFLAYRDEFEFAPAAGEVMRAFADLRARHDGPAAKAMNEARAAFQQGRRDEGYARYQEIVDSHFAAPSYRNVKRWLAERE
jgi:predicted esterase